jgi:hypothetical protein
MPRVITTSVTLQDVELTGLLIERVALGEFTVSRSYRVVTDTGAVYAVKRAGGGTVGPVVAARLEELWQAALSAARSAEGL